MLRTDIGGDAVAVPVDSVERQTAEQTGDQRRREAVSGADGVDHLLQLSGGSAGAFAAAVKFGTFRAEAEGDQFDVPCEQPWDDLLWFHAEEPRQNREFLIVEFEYVGQLKRLQNHLPVVEGRAQIEVEDAESVFASVAKEGADGFPRTVSLRESAEADRVEGRCEFGEGGRPADLVPGGFFREGVGRFPV